MRAVWEKCYGNLLDTSRGLQVWLLVKYTSWKIAQGIQGWPREDRGRAPFWTLNNDEDRWEREVCARNFTDRPPFDQPINYWHFKYVNIYGTWDSDQKSANVKGLCEACAEESPTLGVTLKTRWNSTTTMHPATLLSSLSTIWLYQVPTKYK